MKNIIKVCRTGTISAICCLLLSGCAKNTVVGDYNASEVGKVKTVVPGIIISTRSINIHNDTNGSQTDVIETNPNYVNSGSRSHGVEYVVKLDSGSIISIAQTEDLHLKVKQHILVINGANTRIVPDEGGEDS